MADITTSVAAPFIPEVWANRGLEVLRSLIVAAPLVSKDTDVTTAFNVGSVLHIPYAGTFVANTKAENTPVTLQTPVGSTTNIVLNKHKETSFILEDYASVIAQPGIMDNYIANAMIPLAEQVEADLLGTYASFSGSVGTSGTDLSAATLRAINQRFTTNKIGRGNRKLILAPKDTASLLADTSLQSYFAFGQSDRKDIETGLIVKNLYGLDIYESNMIPVVAGTPNSTKDLAFDPGAIMLATRPLPINAVPGVSRTTVQDPVSGINLRVSIAYNPALLGTQVTCDILYGVGILRDAKGFTVLS